MMKKRIAALLLALALVLSLTACGGTSSQGVVLAENGSTEFTIVYSEGASADILSTADFLHTALLNLTGADFSMAEDMAIGSSDDGCEILLGQTDREESGEAIPQLTGAGEYILQVSGSKIVLASTLDSGVQQAAEELIRTLQENGEPWKLAGNFKMIGTDDSAVQYLPAFTYGTLSCNYNCGDDAAMLIYDADTDGYLAYQKDLEASGFSKYTENDIAQNHFSTYTNDKVSVQLMSLPSMHSVRIIAQPLGYLPALEPSAVQQVVTPSVTQLGLEGYMTGAGSANQIGMSFVYQCSDGSFIVVDGGHNNHEASEQIYQLMLRLAPDPNHIVIAAWLLSHAHPDHMGAIQKFATEHGSDVTLELFVSNMPNAQEMDGGSESSAGNRQKIYSAATSMGAEMMKAYTGQKLYIRDAVIEFLCGIELVAPQSFEYFNNSTLVFSVTLGGQKLMQLGDCGPLESPILTSLYAGALRSDICQIAHHGYQGGTEALYQCISPSYLFWPSGSSAYENYKGTDYNEWVLENADKVWVAKDEIQTVMLPIA